MLRQIGRDSAMTTPIAFREAMRRDPAKRCAVGTIREGQDNGYPYALWAASCGPTGAAERIEETWYKAIQSQGALYVVRKAFNFNPFDHDVLKWVAYLGRVQLCDPRLPDRPCRR